MLRRVVLFAAMTLAWKVPVWGQTPPIAVAGIPAEPRHANAMPGPMAREIRDPLNGYRWVLVPNSRVPSGPGRLLLAGGTESSNGQIDASSQGVKLIVSHARPAFVIHAGDGVIVEEHTAIIDSRLEAVALSPAARGAEFQVRLKMGGAMVRAVAAGAGHATLWGGNGATR